MSIKKRGLGRGLDALIGAAGLAGPRDLDAAPAPNAAEVRQIPVELLQRGRYQPRRDFNTEALEELAASIRAQGLIQPVVVRPIDAGRFEIIAGERRWRAAQMAGLADVPAIVRDVDDESAIAMALIENIQRADLNAIEEAVALSRLQQEFSLTHEAIAAAVGKSRAAVSNYIRLLSLP
ncbi:MAG: ParB/RepB/Spo0J family partition protein, partial [Gammaproteobacteria bacterium]